MRIITALLTLVLIASGSSASTAAVSDGTDPTTDRTQRVRVSITATPEWVRKGGTVTLKGSVNGVRGRTTVTILQKNKGARRWVVEAVKRTSRKGAFTHREDIKTGDRTYKACVKRACDSVLVHMGKPPVRDTAVSITSLSASSVEAGQGFTVQGTASGLDGYSVAIQSYDAGSGSWSTIGNAGVSGGSWVATVALTTSGKAVPLRAYFPGVTGRRASVSNSSSIAVFGWHYLYDLDEVSGYYWNASSFGVNGTTYSKSVALYEYLGDTDAAELDVSRSCIRFAATVGVQQDASNTSTTYTGRLLADAATVWTAGNIRYNTAIPVDVSITGALRLRLEGTVTAGGDDYLVFGDARVLCAF
ncbi:MAG TPA: NPCBM/NEW2 domain-containing protein [Nocardioides sp.]|nr:NPCBM/NEW2 domain-containing protein [Nocardioides sp.]